MAARRSMRKRFTKRQLEAREQHRDRMISMTGQIVLYVASNPEALRGAGMVFEALGRAMQHSADSAKTTSPSGVFDLSAFREKKEPSDG